MKLVVWVDKDGYKRASYIRDSDHEGKAPAGVPVPMPDVGEIDWEGVKRALHNELVDRQLFTWEDVVRSQDGVSTAVMSILRRALVIMYRTKNGGT